MTDQDREADVLARIESFRRSRPRFDDVVVTSAHGAGGSATAALVDAVFLDALAGADRSPLTDAAVLALPSGERIAFTTDSYVVRPRRFPGGSVGHLAVHGTVNDLAMMGARPAWLSLGVVLEEGFAVDELRALVADLAEAAASAGVRVVTGDTKVVGAGAVDGVVLTTAGVGIVPSGRDLAAGRVRPGDRVLLSGTLADHGMAVLLARGELALEADIASDTAPLAGLVEDLLTAAPATRWLRDPTRGGLATVANELATDTGLAVVLDEARLPVRPTVAAACDLLGIDPLHVANEGKLVAIVPGASAEAVVAAMRAVPEGADAAIVGRVVPPVLGAAAKLATLHERAAAAGLTPADAIACGVALAARLLRRIAER
ncbi:MAG TPA: hydrogenase expression/formation protein HypE, partial [Acidimicrobiales bacterium]|nr:hydrogenase expression/formation protein HypE [Acidimicrobiales bacterium]